jgi:hypothetical protein
MHQTAEPGNYSELYGQSSYSEPSKRRLFLKVVFRHFLSDASRITYEVPVPGVNDPNYGASYQELKSPELTYLDGSPNYQGLDDPDLNYLDGRKVTDGGYLNYEEPVSMGDHGLPD